jgi:16S rRNA (cytidine1402-2'-O)-methyltransferase
MPFLYLVPNLLGAVPPENVLPTLTLDTARRLSHWIVENPKPARAFLKTLNLSRPIAELSLEALPEKATTAELDRLLAPCLAGNDMGVLSDAGCPGVADPGAVLVARAHRHGITVRPLVGPSSLLLALMAAGMNGQTFTFHGYLPVKDAERAESLKRLERESRKNAHATQLFIETPYRNAAMLTAALAALSDDTVLCVAADLTADTETVIRKTVREWKKNTDANALQKRPAIFLLQA